MAYKNIAAATSTNVIKSGAGKLNKICINTKGASSNVLTVYDSLSAANTIIATIDTTTAVQTLFFDTTFNIGLTVKSATGTGPDFTVVWDEDNL